MSAIPEDFMRSDRSPRERGSPSPDRRDADSRAQTFWQWFAIAALLFGWIAEATMCAERGF